MALIVEAGGGGDPRERQIGRGELAARAFDAQAARVLTDGHAIVTAEGPRELNRVDADGLRDLPDGHLLIAAVVI